MKPQRSFQSHMLMILSICAGLTFFGCTDTSLDTTQFEQKPPVGKLDIGLDALIQLSDLYVTVTPRSHGYLAEARGKGIIPAGEYGGHHFQITLEGLYTDIGLGMLESGSALVKIRGERFLSVEDPLLQSFCCGEGDLLLTDGEWIFTMYGQVVHTTAPEPHNHLFAGLARESGTMNMNIADQTGTVVIPAVPPHDPGIGLIIGFDTQKFEVEEH